MKLPHSGKEGDEIVPYIRKISRAKTPAEMKYPNPYHVANLAIHCAAYGRTKGYIFVVYPFLNDQVQVFEVIFNGLPEMLQKIKSQIDQIESAEKNQNPFELDVCDNFLNTNGNCILTQQCHAQKGMGCNPQRFGSQK